MSDPAQTPRKSIVAAFGAYDKNKNGRFGAATIETRDLINVLRLLGRRPDSEEELQDMIRQLDEKGTGKIHFLDFYLLMLRIDDDFEKKRMKMEMEKREKERLQRQLQAVGDDDGEGSKEAIEMVTFKESKQPKEGQVKEWGPVKKQGKDMPSLD